MNKTITVSLFSLFALTISPLAHCMKNKSQAKQIGSAFKLVKTFKIPEVKVKSAYVSKNGAFLSIASDSSAIFFIDVNEQEMRLLNVVNDDVYDTCISPDSKYLGIYQSSSVLLYNFSTKKTTVVTDSLGCTARMCFSDDSKLFAYGELNKVVVFDIEKQQEICNSRSTQIQAVCFSPDKKYIATGSYHGTVGIRAIKPEGLIPHYKHERRINSICFSKDGKYVVSGSDDTKRTTPTSLSVKICKFDVLGNIIEAGGYNHDSCVTSVCLCNRYLASADEGGCLKVYNIKNPTKPKRIFEYKDKHGVVSIGFSELGDKLISVSQDGTIRVYQANKKAKKERLGFLGKKTNIFVAINLWTSKK